MSEPKILIVQDENSPLVVLKKALGKAGFQVVTCTTACDALDEMRTEPADLVITSVVLPDLNGFQLSSILKSSEYTEDVPVAIVGTRDELSDGFWRRAALSDLVFERKDVEFDEDKAVERLRVCLSDARPRQVLRQSDTLIISADLNGGDLVRSYRELLSAMFMERSVAHLSRGLVDSINSRVEFMTRFFGYMKTVFGSEITGLVVADPQAPWAIYDIAAGISCAAFEKLQLAAMKSLGLQTEVRSVVHGETLDKGGTTMKAHEIVVVHGSRNEVLGALVIGWTTKQTLDDPLRTIADLLKVHMRPVFKALFDLQTVQTLKQQQTFGSYVDALTGLYNLEFLIGFLQQQLLFSFRQKLPVGVVLVDLDHFLEMNQEYGTEVGDAVLMAVANKISRTIRSSDLLARYSGDTFAVVLPNTDSNGSRILGEKLRGEIEAMEWDTVGKKALKVTASVGCAQFNMEDANPETILRDAKIALMAAKEAGRNQVCVGTAAAE